MDATGADGAGQNSRGRLTGILATLDHAVDDGPPRVRHLVEALGNAAFGALLLTPALIVVTPASGIPGLPSVAGIMIALVAIQMVAGRDHVWLPDWIMRRELSRRRFHQAFAVLRRPVAWIERMTRRRLTWLVTWPFDRAVQALCMVCGLAMPLLEIFPLTSSILALAVMLMAMALMTDDGLLALLGIAVAAAGGLTVLVLARGAVAAVQG